MSTNAGMPKRLRATVLDKVGFFLKEFGMYQIQLVASFAGRLDEDRLVHAMRLLIESEPVLGCGFVPHWFRPWWEWPDELRSEEFFSMEECEPEDSDAKAREFLAAEMDFLRAPQVRAYIVRSDRGGDTLCLKFSHLVADGAAVKEGSYMLADIYRRLGEDPAYRPELNLAGSRSARQLSRQFGLMDKLRIIRRDFRNLRKRLAGWKQRPSSGQQTPGFVRKTFSAERFRAIKDYGRSRGATINDMLLAANYRALYTEVGPMPGWPMGIMATVDMRRYLPGGRAEAICILSSFIHSSIGKEIGADFDGTLARVLEDLNFQKGDCLGLGDYPGMVFLMNFLPFGLSIWLLKRLVSLLMRSGFFKSVLTNLGIIEESLLDFGGPTLSDAYIEVPPSFYPEMMLIVGITSFREEITLTSGLFGSQEDQALVERIFNVIDDELPG